jgi:CRISPR-associated protein Csh1
MIHEITQFIDHLEDNNQEIFSENLELKEGFYAFVEKEDDNYVIDKNSILQVNDKTEKNNLYNAFLERYINSEMLNAMKSFNSGPKVFISIGSPFAIALSGKAYKANGRTKLKNAADAYFKAAYKYIDTENKKHITWYNELKHFVDAKMFDYLDSHDEFKNVKDAYLFCFFHKEPIIEDYKTIHAEFLSNKLFNKDKYNIKTETGEIYGISDDMSGFNDSKPFLKHQTGPIEVNYRVNGKDAMKLHEFFRLQKKNKLLPNPMPIFVDEKELTEEVVNFYKTDKKKGHKEIIEHLLKDRKDDLQNYYLIYFHNAQKGSRIIDLDFVPVFEYKMNDLPSIKPLFQMKSKKEGNLFKNYKIENRFQFQNEILNPVFNKQLIQETKNGLWIKYFDDLEVKPEYGATEAIVNLFYKYRKSLYDYIYKSKREAITDNMFQDIMINSIIDNILHDEDFNKTYSIKNKLNIWFNLYNYFNNNKNKKDMASKIQELLEKCRKVANNDGEHLSEDPKEFAFIAGQVIYFLLDKSESANKSHAMLEPFLQKTKVDQLQKAITNTINAYKHAIDFGKGRFERLSKEVLAYDKDINLKDVQPLFLAGYFAEPIIYEKNN